jgi:hypothetical protein
MNHEMDYRSLELLVGTSVILGHGLLLTAAGVALLLGKTWPTRIAGSFLALAGVAESAFLFLNVGLALLVFAGVGVCILAMLLAAFSQRRAANDAASLVEVLARCQPPEFPTHDAGDSDRSGT